VSTLSLERSFFWEAKSSWVSENWRRDDGNWCVMLLLMADRTGSCREATPERLIQRAEQLARDRMLRLVTSLLIILKAGGGMGWR